MTLSFPVKDASALLNFVGPAVPFVFAGNGDFVFGLLLFSLSGTSMIFWMSILLPPLKPVAVEADTGSTGAGSG